MKIKRLPIIGSFALFFLFSLGAPPPLLAQDELPEGTASEEGAPNASGISLTARIGFDGFRKTGSWVPVTLLVANEGPAVEGRIVIFGSRGQTQYSTDISLPNQSRKRVHLNFFDANLATSYEIFIVNDEGDTVAAAQSNTVRNLTRDDSLLYGVVSDQPEALELLEKVDGGRTEVGVAFMDIEELPLNAALWRDLDVLIFSDVDTNGLTAEQRENLEQWLQLGGQLVVTGGASWQKTTSAMADLLPVEVSGSRSIDDLPGFSEQIGLGFRDPGPYVIADSQLRQGSSIYNEAGLPILARRSIGRGAVFFLAFDPQFAPLDDWDGSELLWDEVASRTLRPSFWESGFTVEQEVSSAVANLPSLTLPSIFLLAGFVLLYIVVIGPVNFLFLRQTNRRELAWLTIPGTILFFSLSAFLLGLQFKGNTVLINHMSVVTGRVGDVNADVDSGVAVYSPRRGMYDIVFEENTLVRSLDSWSFDSDELSVQLANDVRLDGTQIDVGEIGTYAARKTGTAPQVDGRMTIDPDNPNRYVITLTNNDQFTLENAGIWFQGTIIPVGDIEPGSTITENGPISGIEIARFEALEDGVVVYTPYAELDTTSGNYRPSPFESNYYDLLGTSSYYGDSVYYPRYQLLESLFDPYGTDVIFERDALATLVFWSEEEQLEISLERGRYENSAVSLYLLEIPFDS